MEGNEQKEDPSLVFTKAVMGQIQKEDVLSMVLAQREMLMRYEKTNEMLLNFNMLSGSRYETTMVEFRKHTALLYEMKKDLDTIFRRIRLLKSRLSGLHPAAFSACSDVYNVLEEKTGEKVEEEEGEKRKLDRDVEDGESADPNTDPAVKEAGVTDSFIKEAGVQQVDHINVMDSSIQTPKDQVTEKKPDPPDNT